VRIQWIAVTACLAVLAACGSNKSNDAGDEQTATPVEVATARVAPISDILTAEAIVYPVQQASIMPKISAPVVRFYAQRGDRVHKGELLAVLDNRDLQAAARESEQLFKQAEAQYDIAESATVPEDMAKAKADAEAAKQAFAAAAQVYQNRVRLVREGALPEQQAEQAKVAMVQAQAQYETAQKYLAGLESVGRREQLAAAKAQMQAAKAHYESAEAQLSYSEVRSPMDGVVSDRPLYVGEMASSGSAMFTIMDVSKITVRASVPVGEAAQMRVGQPATITGAGGSVQGKVTVVSPAVDQSTTTVEVRAEAPNPNDRIKPGETARLSVNVGEVKNAVIVPLAALLTSDTGGDEVMIAGADNRAHARAVQTGVRQGDEVQILSGVKAGERVIVEGALGLEDGAQIKIVPAGELENPPAPDAKDAQ
jgi:HlyD family secretion protein